MDLSQPLTHVACCSTIESATHSRGLCCSTIEAATHSCGLCCPCPPSHVGLCRTTSTCNDDTTGADCVPSTTKLGAYCLYPNSTTCAPGDQCHVRAATHCDVSTGVCSYVPLVRGRGWGMTLPPSCLLSVWGLRRSHTDQLLHAWALGEGTVG